MSRLERRPPRHDAAPSRGGGRPSKPRYTDSSNKPGKPAKSDQPLQLSIRPDWHAAPLPDIAVPEDPKPIPASLLDLIHEHALSLLATENASYVAQTQKSSSHSFMSTIMSSGTWNDKVSALTLAVQESPLHTMKPLESLIGLAAKRTRSQALVALGALKDFFSQGVILPSDRKLRVFTKQPGLIAALQGIKPTWTAGGSLPKGLTPSHLMVWAYEDWLKKQYFEILKVLESWCNDEVEFARLRAITFVWELLKERPEQEENLLRLLVNKLGDTSKKVASRASHLLLQLENTHPSMKLIILNAVESDILLRPGQSSHAKYYAVITLNQTILQTSDPDVANKLLDMYFGLFVTSLNRSKNINKIEKAEVVADSKALDEQSKAFEEQSRKRKRPSVPASGVNKPDQELEDKIIAQVLTGINRAFPFTSQDSAVLEKHLDTMYRITHSANFNTSIQALLLIQQISTAHHISTDRYMRTLYESLLDPRLIKSSKQTMYLNLLYRSLKSDISVRRIKAFVKRLLQIITMYDPSFVCGVLYLLVELQNIFPGVKAMLDQPEMADDDEEEVFADVPEDSTTMAPTNGTAPASPNLAVTAINTLYDPRKRDPEHSNADRTCLWELPTWAQHYHPSVTLFASHLLSASSKPSSISSKPPAKPDPASHTLVHFLDRFAYRNPKLRADAALRGSSLMQPALASTNTVDSLLGTPKDAAQPLNTETFWQRKVEDVAPEEVFFHKYFAEVGPRRVGREKRKEEKARKAREDEEDEEDEDEKLGGEEEIWKALVGSNPELEEGSDVDMDGDEEDDEDLELEMGEDDDDLLGSDDEMGAAGDEDEGDDDAGVGLGGVDFEDGLLDDVPLTTVGDFGDEDAGEEESLFPAEQEEKPRKGKKKLPGKDKPDLESKRSKRRKRTLKDLPTFASVEDYEKMLGDDEGIDEG